MALIIIIIVEKLTNRQHHQQNLPARCGGGGRHHLALAPGHRVRCSGRCRRGNRRGNGYVGLSSGQSL